ncbi:MAG TPA: ribonuclease E/G, partial [Bradyrhizobium sp.]|nr:ribonuclease E/G [Bradyrhizobium sp.]
SEAPEGAIAEEGESEEDESGEQPGFAGAEGAQTGERRPRRRGRRGGRRRRGGGPEDGLAGSIADELSPLPASEAENAVADFDGSEPAPSLIQPEPVAPAPEQRAEPVRETVAASAPEETAAEAERTARRRSTVREKVSFLTSAPPDAAPATPSTIEEPAPAPAEAAPAASSEQPRKAGWWSRRFGGGE